MVIIMKQKKKKKNYFLKNFINEFKSTSKFSMFEVLIIVLISISFGIVIGYILTYTNGGIKYDSNLSDIISTYSNISNNYYKKVNQKDLSKAAISGMLNELDDNNSFYLDDSTSGKFNESIEGSFVGIGITIQYDGEYNKVIEVNKGDPADIAGIKKDDIILSIDDKDCKGIYGDDISKLIRGKPGTEVKIKIKRKNVEKVIKVLRGKIEIQNVTYQVYEYDETKIGYIKINVVSANSYKQFEKALLAVEKKKIDSVIIDVRGNPGGYLVQARNILSLFFDKKTVLYQLVEKGSKTKKIYSTSKEKRNYPIVILVDCNSASASEVIASCFKERYKNASVVGTSTYGKGTVQESKTLNSGNAIKYTIEGWLTSKGNDLEGKGLKPDYVIELTEEYYNNPSIDNDAQFQKAVELLKKSH